MNSTPRTDAVCFPVGRMHPDTVVVGVDDCRQLEHELNESNKIIRQQQLLDEKNLMLMERIKRLEEAGQELLFDNDNMANIYRWHKAKEVKR